MIKSNYGPDSEMDSSFVPSNIGQWDPVMTVIFFIASSTLDFMNVAEIDRTQKEEVRSDKRERERENGKVLSLLTKTGEKKKKEKRKSQKKKDKKKEFSLQSSQSPSQYEIASSN